MRLAGINKRIANILLRPHEELHRERNKCGTRASYISSRYNYREKDYVNNVRGPRLKGRVMRGYSRDNFGTL